MLKDNLKTNETIKPNSNEIEKLKVNFPQFFDKEGNFLEDRLKEVLKQNDINLIKEGYELKFLGKSYARYLSSTKTETFVVPHLEENAKEENKESENLYIIGDNLDALKHLLGSYSGKIKCIYIDPPYNTGSDGFVYPDNFSFDADKLSNMLGINEDEAERIINLKGKSSHSAWLTFMYPRLLLARELLSDDGVIFISIDDNEQANLKMICDEIFGEENSISQIAYQGLDSVKNDAKYFSKNNEFIFVYSKQKEFLNILGVEKTEKQLKTYKNYDDDPRGAYLLTPIHAKSGSANSVYTYTFNNGVIWSPPIGTYARFSKETLAGLDKDNKIYFGKNGKGVPQKKTFLNEVKNTMPPSTFWSAKEYGSTRQSKAEVSKLLGDGIFETPKSLRLIKILYKLIDTENDYILDFFSGSATSAEAIMRLNAEDGGNRKYILVQLPEQIKEDKPAYKAGYKTIDEIGRERIKRAAKKIKEDTGADIDYGFKTYSLKTLEESTLTKLVAFDDGLGLSDITIDIYDTEYAKAKESILATYLVLDGYGLSTNTERYQLDTYICDKVSNSLYIIEEGLNSEDVAELIRRIETLELDITRVVVYSDSIRFNIINELRKNLANLRNNKSVELIERY